MALLITKPGLLKVDGTEITTQPIVRFFDQGSLKGFNRKFFIQYWTSIQLEEEGYAPIQIIYDENKNTLPSDFIKELTIKDLGYWEQVVNSIMPNEPAAVKVPFVYHIWIKNVLENYLGPNTVDIRLDLM